MTAARHEVEALGRLAGDAADRFATTPAQALHAAVAGRVFGALGPGAAPVRALHDQVAATAYASVRSGVRSAACLAAGAAARRQRGEPRAVSRSARGAAVQAVANGLVGHELARDGDPLAIPLGFWQDGAPVEPTRDGLARALPDATPRLAVFVHGLFETERAWRFGGAEPYSALLRDAAGWTPLHVRYNTGLPTADNGRALNALLAATAAAWPSGRLDRIALVGHSMGGLVARCAARTGRDAREPWADRLSHLACLGSPHRGSPVEQGVHGAARLLSLVPETAAFAGVLEHRSAGIRELRRGIEAGPLIEGVQHLFVAATVTADPQHPVGLVLGDLLVRPGSAGGPDGCEIDVRDVAAVGGLHHFRLLNDPAVAARLQDFLGREPGGT